MLKPQHAICHYLTLLVFLVSSFCLSGQLSVSIEAEGKAICPGGSTTINSIVTGSSGVVTYSWNVPAGYVGSTSTPSIQANAGGTYSLVVGDTKALAISEDETILELQFEVNISPPGGSFCAKGAGLELSAIAIAVAEEYTWEVPPGFIGSTDGPSILANVAGEYSVTLIQGKCLVKSDRVTVTAKSLNLNLMNVNPTSPGDNDGKIIVEVSGGDPPYDWAYSTVGSFGKSGQSESPSFSIGNLQSGAYSVSVSDISKCLASQSISLLEPACDLQVEPTPKPPTCHNGEDGSIRLRIENGKAPYVINWEGPASSGVGTMNNVYTITDLPPGVYLVIVKDDAGCDWEMEVVVPNPLPLNVSITGDLAFCQEEGGTILSTSPSGWKAYQWSDGTSGSSLSVTAGGPYSVTVADGMGCTATASVNVIELPPIDISLINSESNLQVSCAKDCDGKIVVNVEGGAEKGYEFEWEGPGFSSADQNIFDLCPGEYNLTVTDSEGCTGFFSQEISDAVPLSLTLQRTNPSCANETDGRIRVVFSGGSPSYDIAWSGTASGSATNIMNNHNITGLGAGNYTVTLTDGNGCTISRSVTLLDVGEITFNGSELSPSCEGSNTGSILISNIMNGNAPYTITWSLGGSSESATTAGTSYTIENLEAGTYTILVKDDNGCSANVQEVIVTEEAEINVDIVGDIVLCSDQNSGVLATNPAGFSDYKWSTGPTTATITITDPGNYAVTVTDGGGCVGRGNITVTRSDKISISTIGSSSNLIVSCEGNCDGTISPAIVGGSPPYETEWTGPGGYSSTALNIGMLCPGNYTLSVEDSNGCTGSYTQSIMSSGNINVSLEASPVSCPGEKDGEISSEVSGGQAPYTYAWSEGSSSPNITDLPPGTYSVTVSDSKGCMQLASANVGEMSGVDGSIFPANKTICEGETLSIIASGGTSYNWSTGETTANIEVSPLTDQTYFVTITVGGSSCSDVLSTTVKVNDFSSATILVAETSGLSNNDGEVCKGDNVRLTATGGVTYMWEGGLSNPLNISPLESSTYSVTVTDGNGCSAVLEQEITVNLNPDASIDLNDFTYVIGESQPIGNSSLANCGEFTDCRWEIDGIFKSSDCSDVEHIFNVGGESSISLTVENECGCVDTEIEDVDIFSADDCKLIFNVQDNGEFRCTGESIVLDLNFIPKTGCALGQSEILVTQGGDPVGTYELIGSTIVFSEPGEYDIEAVYTDDCNCSATVSRRVVINEAPDASFAEINPTVSCSNSIIDIQLAGLDPGERVTVRFDGFENTYEGSNFQIFVEDPGSYILEIIRVSRGDCVQEVTGEVLQIEVIDNLEVIDASFVCEETSGTYTLTLVTTGGDPSASLSTLFEDAFADGETLVLFNLNPQIPYEISLKRGDFCEPVIFQQSPVACNCSSNAGSLDDDIYYTGCSGEFYDISGVLEGNDDINTLFDTLLFVLHDGAEAGELGEVYDIFPLSKTLISNDFPDHIPNKEYQLSVVSFRKFDFLNLIPGGIQAFNFMSGAECASVSNTVPVIWHGSNVSISGPSQVCENAYNEIFVSSGIGEGADLTINIPGLTDDNYDFVPTDGKLYVHFVSGTEADVPISIISMTSHTDYIKGDTIETTCTSSTQFQVRIDEAHAAPDTGAVILWPGGIFASTDTLDNICHRWGKSTRISATEVVDTIFEGADERFFFADLDDVISLNENRQIWVETYFCDDPVCYTRNIYNGQFPISLIEGNSNGGFSIFPNPNDGFFTLRTNNQYLGDLNLRIYDIHGRQIHQDTYYKGGFVVSKPVNLKDAANGVYIVILEGQGGLRWINKIVKQQDK